MFENSFTVREHPLDSIRHERLRRLHAYWEANRQSAPWLAYDRLRPEEVAYALADVAVLEKSEAASDLVLNVRLAGETIRLESAGFARGKSSADFRPAWFRDHMVACCRNAFTRAGPVYATVTLRYAGTLYPYEQLLLPLVRRGPRARLPAHGGRAPAELDRSQGHAKNLHRLRALKGLPAAPANPGGLRPPAGGAA